MIDRREFGKAAAGAMAIAASAVGPRLASAQQPHKWKMQSLWQAGSVNQKIFEDWAKRVKEASGGRIEIEPLAVGTIVATARRWTRSRTACSTRTTAAAPTSRARSRRSRSSAT